MPKAEVYLVFVIPAVFTIVFGTVVFVGALEELDRDLNMWPGEAHYSLLPDMDKIVMHNESVFPISTGIISGNEAYLLDGTAV